MWKTLGKFGQPGQWRTPFIIDVVDYGTKKRINPSQALPERQTNISNYYDRELFWEELLEPRTPEKAKKRLVELPSQDKLSVLICWLITSKKGKASFFTVFPSP